MCGFEFTPLSLLIIIVVVYSSQIYRINLYFEKERADGYRDPVDGENAQKMDGDRRPVVAVCDFVCPTRTDRDVVGHRRRERLGRRISVGGRTRVRRRQFLRRVLRTAMLRPSTARQTPQK